MAKLIWHLTPDGAHNLCGRKLVPYRSIHITYAARLLDRGYWCKSCVKVFKKKWPPSTL